MNADADKILDELVYERVRASVNLCQLVILEEDLEQSIERALGASDEDALALARRRIDQAWRRVESEWNELRHRQ